MRESVSELTQRPAEGCYIQGLFLEGARWDPLSFQVAESRPKELYTEMAVIWLVPVPNRKPPTTGFYLCPIYKTLTRAGKETREGSQSISCEGTALVPREIKQQLGSFSFTAGLVLMLKDPGKMTLHYNSHVNNRPGSYWPH